jgi:hypothetical protein
LPLIVVEAVEDVVSLRWGVRSDDTYATPSPKVCSEGNTNGDVQSCVSQKVGELKEAPL